MTSIVIAVHVTAVLTIAVMIYLVVATIFNQSQTSRRVSMRPDADDSVAPSKVNRSR